MEIEAEGPARFRDLFILLLVALAILAPGISSLPPVDRDEPRYEVATTQMLASGNFINIRYQDQPRYLQPAGVYWLQAIPTALFSAPGHRAVWTYRLPSLLGAVAASLITAWAAGVLFGRRVGLTAGALLAACLSLGFEARIGKTDGALLATVTAAEFALMRAYLAETPLLTQSLGRPASWRVAAGFWAALGCGVLLKGPIILLVSGLTVLALLLWDRRAGWLKGLRAAWGVPLMLAIAAPWYGAIGVVSSGRFYSTAIGHSLLNKVAHGQQAHGAPFGYHLIGFPITFWPGSLLAVMAAPFVWRQRQEPQVRFLLCWLVPSWIVFEAIKTKLPHYVLPLFPAIALLAALALYAPRPAVRPWMRWAFYAFAALWTVLSLALAALSPVAVWQLQGRIDPLAIALAAGGALSVGAALWLLRRGRRGAAVGALAAASALVAVNAYAVGLPQLSAFWLSPRAAAMAKAAAPCPSSLLITTPYHEPSLVFLNGPDRTYLAKTAADAADRLASTGACGMALVGAREAADFQRRAGEDRLALRILGEVQGRDYADNRTLTLTLYAPAAPPAAKPPAPRSPAP